MPGPMHDAYCTTPVGNAYCATPAVMPSRPAAHHEQMMIGDLGMTGLAALLVIGGLAARARLTS